MSKRTGKPRRDVYADVTAQLVNALESGAAPWRKPWRSLYAGDGRPHNAVSKHAYRGINQLVLGMVGDSFGDPRFLTFKQARDAGGCVRKGERGTLAVFWKTFVREDAETGKERVIPMLRSFTVFNASQCDGLELAEAKPAKTFEPIRECERVVSAMRLRPALKHGGDAACYVPSWDEVHMPKPEAFTKREGYYHTLFHELAHATGHDSRLKRPGIETVAAFGSPTYSREELVAEMASAMVCRAVGIDPQVEQTASYLESWIRVLKGDARLAVQAAGNAQKAADWILSETMEVNA